MSDDELKDANRDEETQETQDENIETQAEVVESDSEGDESEELEEDLHSDYVPASRFDASAVHHLSGMYKSWFLDYASYVILDRSVPHIEDGLKPVQRRILHSMKRMDDGRYNKVANIVGHTMQFHPHGDASIGDALVQLGQKNLLVDTQGNWGNILTGDAASAPRYIEARLSKFANEVVFNPKTTEWQRSYDNRNKEPVTLPVKFPLLLAQGTEGIAVGLSCKILPHNFGELCDAAIHYLKGEEFHLYPDFQTGGSIDVSRYDDGQRGGSLKVRAKIEKLDAKTLVIREIPFSKTTAGLKDSILRAVEKGKIKVKNVQDLTSSEVEILVHLVPGTSCDKTIDALYAFSDCEISISPNCCVIEDNKPCFLSVSDVLRHSVDRTMGLLRRELQIRKNELLEQLFFCSLEKIFIEERMYKEKNFENAESMDDAIAFLDKQFEPFKKQLIRAITREDLLKLMEIKMQRILKFNADKAEELMARIKKDIRGIDYDLSHMTKVTIKWFQNIKDHYGADHPRKTEIKNFDTIVASKVVEANQKLYINRKEGFIGTGLKKNEFVCNCSDLDDIILFYRDGRYKVIRVSDKIFVGKGVIHVQVFKKNDTRTIYNVVYRDGKDGRYFIKRFNIPAIARDREFDLTNGEPGSKIVYFTANPNGEAEVIYVKLDPACNKKNLIFERDFSEIDIKGRSSKGRLLTKFAIERIGLKSHGHSTLGGRKVWFDEDIKRLNYEGHGLYLGEFGEEDKILVMLKNGDFYLSDIDTNNHFEDNMLLIEKWDTKKIWTVVLRDADNKRYPYLKRFVVEPMRKRSNFLGDNPKHELLAISDKKAPRFLFTFGGKNAEQEPLEIDAVEFIGVKGYKARGKRVTTDTVAKVEELESQEPETEIDETTDENTGAPDADEPSAPADETTTNEKSSNTIELSLFSDEEP